MFSAFIAADSDPVLIADWPEDISHAAALLTDREGGRLLARAVRFELLEPNSFASEGCSKLPHNAYYDAVALRDWVAQV